MHFKIAIGVIIIVMLMLSITHDEFHNWFSHIHLNGLVHRDQVLRECEAKSVCSVALI